MHTLETLRRQLESAQQLHQVAHTMKSLAAVNIRQYEEAVEAVSTYFDTIELGLQIVLRERPVEHVVPHQPATETLGLVVFGSDQGLVGQFNNRIAAFALDQIERMGIEPQQRTVLVVGRLALATFEQLGQPVERLLPMPSSLSGVTSTVQDLLLHLDQWRTARQLDQVVLFYNTPRSGTTYEPTLRRLLPLSDHWLRRLQQREWQSRGLPFYRMDWAELFLALVRQYLFVSLYRALVDSLASENASRLDSMQAAEKNIRERLDELHRQYHRLRQSSITEEVLDITSGFEALKDSS
ncbi:MAG: F0F1 ATP synthase subunit gamma [Chloroflexi bacterium]|nr:F0F1 ATP synthase subunit gamma [Chloroflexota bacterium]